MLSQRQELGRFEKICTASFPAERLAGPTSNSVKLPTTGEPFTVLSVVNETSCNYHRHRVRLCALNKHNRILCNI